MNEAANQTYRGFCILKAYFKVDRKIDLLAIEYSRISRKYRLDGSSVREPALNSDLDRLRVSFTNKQGLVML